MTAKQPLNVGIAGLGAVGLDVAKRLIAGVPGLKLVAVAVRDADKARHAGLTLCAFPPEANATPSRAVTDLLQQGVSSAGGAD